MSQLPVIAAVPNYNMAPELEVLLPRLIKQHYKQIFVLDDASTDNSRAVAERFAPAVTFIAGRSNKGAGGNRNRILGVLSYDALIHFMDADTIPDTKDIVKAIQRAVPDGDFAFVGGLAKDRSGLQNVWNYGPRPGLRSEIDAYRQSKFGQFLKKDPLQAASFRSRHHQNLADWPNPLQAPQPVKTFWALEQNVVFRSDIFKAYGGFDETNRETEIVELSLRMHQDNLDAYFDPSFSIIHTEAQVRNYNRAVRKRRECLQLAYKYGIFEWLKY